MFLGILAFVAIGLMAFWLMVFLMGFLPFWIGAYFIDKRNEGKEEVSAE
ncbi:MAG: hypothetical protein ACPG6V_01545 [Flavobacteriales bacterium]